MRRCFCCGVKKQDDNILCEKCAKELEERLEEKKQREKEGINGRSGSN